MLEELGQCQPVMRTSATERFTEIDLLYLFEELYYNKITGRMSHPSSRLSYMHAHKVRIEGVIYNTMMTPRKISGTVGQYAVCFVVHDPRLSCLLP